MSGIGWVAALSQPNKHQSLTRRSSAPAPRSGLVFSGFVGWRGALIVGVRPHSTLLFTNTMLRSATRQQIIDLIESSFFGSQNYEISFTGLSDSELVRITFIPDSRFLFSATHLNEEFFQVKEAPGRRFLTPETVNVQGFTNLKSRIQEWLTRLRQEVVAENPIGREIVDLRQEIEVRLSQLGEAASSYFTKDEANSLQQRLSEFEARLRELAGENEDLKSAVENLSKAVADLTEASESVNKGTWLRMASGRLLSGMKSLVKSKEAREFALEAAKKFLLEGPK